MHETFLRRCFELAQEGECLASPNPIVGSVIVHKGEIVSEGFHRKAGEAHAEVNAISKLPENISSKECDIYVSLEPCAHHGKTPPCSDLIVKTGFRRLIFSSYDLNPEVSGKGIERIKAAGIEVIEASSLKSEIKEESDYLNRKFFKSINNPSPHNKWITLKIAISSDGSMLSEGKWITNSESRKQVHRLRATNDLLISGANSIKLDNSKLNVRHSASELGLADVKDPDVCILYRETTLDTEHEIFKLESDRKVFQEKEVNKALESDYKRILIETGPNLSSYFIENNLIDEAIIYQSTKDKALNQDWQELLKAKGYTLYKTEKIESASEISDLKEIWLLG